MPWAVPGVDSCLVGSGSLLWVHTIGAHCGIWTSQSSTSFTCIYLFSNSPPWTRVDISGPFFRYALSCKCYMTVWFGLFASWAAFRKTQLFYQLELQEKLSQGSLAEQASPFPSTGSKHSLSDKAAAVSYQPCWNDMMDEWVSLLCLLQCWPKAAWKYSKSLFNSSSKIILWLQRKFSPT